MGFLAKIKGIFGGGYGKTISNLDQHISNLKDIKKKADFQLEKLKKSTIAIPSFEIKTTSSKNIELKTFNPPKPRPIITMKDLMIKRKKEEEQRRKQLYQQIIKNFDTVRSLVKEEELDSAESLLLSTFSTIQELKDIQLKSVYDDLSAEIKEVREQIRQREIERLEEEARQRAEEEAARREQERLEKIREEEERQELLRKTREYEQKLSQEEEFRRLEKERLTALVTRKKEESDEILNYLRIKQVYRFYHFTSVQNINQIKRLGGLYSWYYCRQNDINIPDAGGDSKSRSLDCRHGLEDYVRLSFCSEHPMAYRKHQEGSELVQLYIDIEVATFKDTLFTDRNAASNAFARGGRLEDLERVNIEATKLVFLRNTDPMFPYKQAECMIKTFVPIKYITNIDNPEQMYF